MNGYYFEDAPRPIIVKFASPEGVTGAKRQQTQPNEAAKVPPTPPPPPPPPPRSSLHNIAPGSEEAAPQGASVPQVAMEVSPHSVATPKTGIPSRPPTLDAGDASKVVLPPSWSEPPTSGEVLVNGHGGGPVQAPPPPEFQQQQRLPGIVL